MEHNIRDIGAIFCHVISSVAGNQDSLFITEGNQTWNGATPSLIINAKGNKMNKLGVIVDKSNTLEPRA